MSDASIALVEDGTLGSTSLPSEINPQVPEDRARDWEAFCPPVPYACRASAPGGAGFRARSTVDDVRQPAVVLKRSGR